MAEGDDSLILQAGTGDLRPYLKVERNRYCPGLAALQKSTVPCQFRTSALTKRRIGA
jgi:hypothetical protein